MASPVMRHLLAIGVLLACAAPAAAENLMDVYRQAQLRDPLWAAARANYAANVERLPQGRALLRPTLNLSASTTETTSQKVKTPTINTTFEYRTETYSLQLTQPIYRKQNFAGYTQGEALAAQAEFDLDNARQDLILRVTQTYLAVLSAQDVADFARAEKAAIERLLALAKRNFSVGNATLVDVHEAQAAFDLAAAQEIAAVNDLEIKREALRFLTGAPAAILAALARPIELVGPQPADMEKWAEESREHPQVKSQEQTLESARQEIEKNIGGHYPTLDLTATRSYSDAGGGTQGFPVESTTDQIGLVLQLPLYQGGAISSKVREAAARKDEVEQRLESVRRQSAQQAREQYLAVLNGVARVRALEQAQASNQRALESTVLGYERGLRTNIDVVNAQRQLFRTRRDLSQARYDYLLARLRLKAAVGQLGEPELEDINRLLG